MQDLYYSGKKTSMAAQGTKDIMFKNSFLDWLMTVLAHLGHVAWVRQGKWALYHRPGQENERLAIIR